MENFNFSEYNIPHLDFQDGKVLPAQSLIDIQNALQASHLYTEQLMEDLKQNWLDASAINTAFNDITVDDKDLIIVIQKDQASEKGYKITYQSKVDFLNDDSGSGDDEDNRKVLYYKPELMLCIRDEEGNLIPIQTQDEADESVECLTFQPIYSDTIEDDDPTSVPRFEMPKAPDIQEVVSAALERIQWVQETLV